MEKTECKENYWIICENCKGDGKKRKKPRKKTRLHYQAALNQFKKTDCEVANDFKDAMKLNKVQFDENLIKKSVVLKIFKTTDFTLF